MKSNFLTIASLLLLSSCVSGVADANFGVDQSVESENLLSIEATMSRVTDLSFESGDVIGLTMTMDSDGSTFVENHEMTFTGSRFLSKLEWYSDKTKSSTMTAYYPYSASGFPTTFNVAKEQTSAEAYVASDLIFAAQSGVLPTSSATSMLFHHAMSRIVVEVENGRGVAISKVEICSLYQGASVDVASLSVAVDSSSSMVDITAMQVSESVYRAIVVPQRAALIFKITFADGSVFVREKASVEYKSGETYTAKIVVDVDFDEYDDYIVYDGVTYNTKSYSVEGYGELKIMVDNMRYLPAGVTPSSDPSDASGIWYSYSLAPDAADADADYIATALTDAASVAKHGYLYTLETVFGEKLTAENYDTFEGVRGICPPGWHVPTRMELHALCGDGTGLSDDLSAPFYDTSVFYGSIQRANELGFNHTYPGSVTNDRYSTPYIATDYTASSYVSVAAPSVVGENSTTYYMCSSAIEYWSNSDFGSFYSMYTTHASSYIAKGCLSVMRVNSPYGQSLRCVKDNI